MDGGFGPVGMFILDILQTVVIAFAIFLLVWWLFLQPHKVDGRSMDPTFCNGDMLLTDKFTYRFRDPERYEIIVFKSPVSVGRDLIKRIIGLPGETVEIRGQSVYVNAQKLPENYLPKNRPTDGHKAMVEGKPIVIPQGEYIVMGDNREHSSDSREFGTIKREAMIGRSLLRYWPIPAFGPLGHGGVQTQPRPIVCQ